MSSTGIRSSRLGEEFADILAFRCRCVPLRKSVVDHALRSHHHAILREAKSRIADGIGEGQMGWVIESFGTLAVGLAVAGVFACAGYARAADAPVQVMILATVHMDNPGLDFHNTKVDDVLQRDFQAQIARVTDALARFKPTAVHVESSAEAARERYALYLSDKLEPSRNEVVQLGFRLARSVGLQTVHGIDVLTDFPYLPVEAFAKAHGQQGLLDSMHAEIEMLARSEEELLETKGIAAELRRINDPEDIRNGHAYYRTMLRIGAGNEQPGAELLTAWYRRNFLICANFLQLSRPGDRIVVIFGSGHSFLLRQCVIETPGLQLIEANSYLPE
jgi:Family of unknown function (DUF5694)